MAQVFRSSPYTKIDGHVLTPRGRHVAPVGHGCGLFDAADSAHKTSKKRRLGHSGMDVAAEYEGVENNVTGFFGNGGGKRSRTSGSFGGASRQEEPMYTHRELEHELHKQNLEFSVAMSRKEEEVKQITAAFESCRKETEKAEGENKLLKKAVVFHSNKSRELESQLQPLQQAAVQAANYIRRLEQTNYALSLRLSSMDQPGNTHHNSTYSISHALNPKPSPCSPKSNCPQFHSLLLDNGGFLEGPPDVF
ncbi:unnamed protein product [Chrysoparadoxa australica]